MAGVSHDQKNAYIGHFQPVSEHYGGKQIISNDYKVRQGEQSGSHQLTSRTSFVDKQTGKYARLTNKEVASSGETLKERSTGRVGYKDEYKTTTTKRIGDKRGYIEHQVEETYRRVTYGGNSGSERGNYGAGSYNNGGKAAITYDRGNKYEDYEDSDDYCDGYDYHESTYYSDSD